MSALERPVPQAPRLEVVPLQRKPDEELVTELRKLLDEAERGEIRAFAFAFERLDRSGASYRICLPGCRPYELLGNLHVLCARLTDWIRDLP